MLRADRDGFSGNFQRGELGGPVRAMFVGCMNPGATFAITWHPWLCRTGSRSSTWHWLCSLLLVKDKLSSQDQYSSFCFRWCHGKAVSDSTTNSALQPPAPGAGWCCGAGPPGLKAGTQGAVPVCKPLRVT